MYVFQFYTYVFSILKPNGKAMKTALLVLFVFPLFLGVKSFFGFKSHSGEGSFLINHNAQPELDGEKQYADSMMVIAKEYIKQGKYKDAQDVFELCIPIYKELNDSEQVGTCLSYLGTTYYYEGKYKNALKYYEQSLGVYKKTGDEKRIFSLLNNIGAIYYFQGDYIKALDYYKEALKHQEKLEDKSKIAALTLNIGGVYAEIGDLNNSMDYLQKALKINEQLKNRAAISQSLNGIGEIYMKKGNFTNALYCFNRSLSIADSINNKQRMVEVLHKIGELYSQKKDHKEALFYLDKCLEYSRDINSSRFMSISQISIAKNLYESGQNTEAVRYCKQGLNIASEIGAVMAQKDACECLYKIYKSQGNSQKALAYYEQKHMLEDSLRTEETANKILHMEFQRQALIDSLAYAKKEFELQQVHQKEILQKERQRNVFIASVCLVLLIAGALLTRLNYVRKSRAKLQIEKNRSESLLLNILPEEIAEELKEKGYVDARDFNLASILFTDFKSFTETSEKLTPHALVNELNICFKEFDLITQQYGLEKIKTIGDAYMLAGGLPVPDKNAVKNIVLAGLDMQEFICKRKYEHELLGLPAFEMRVGIHAGPIVAGIVGVKKFQYDIWGDTVNTASRMESNGAIGRVNISEAVYELTRNEKELHFEYRGLIKAKGKGEMKMYFVKRANSPRTKITLEGKKTELVY